MRAGARSTAIRKGVAMQAYRKAGSAVGSVRKIREGHWEVRVSGGYRRDGSQRSVSRVARSEEEAEAMRVRLAVELGRMPTLGDPLPLDAYFWGVFLPRVERTTTRANRDFYASAWRSHVSPALGHLDVGDVPHAAVAEWCSQLPPASAPAYVRCLRAVLRAAWADGLVAEEPMRQRLRLPRRSTRPAPVWTADEAAEAITRVRGEDIEPLVLVMLGAGLSTSEALARSWEDFGEGCASVEVSGAYTQRDGMKEPKTSRRWRTVPVLPQCAERLEELREAAGGTGPICVNRKGQRMGPGTSPRRWARLFWGPRSDLRTREELAPCALWGLPRIPMNRLRATHETLMQQAGVSDSLNAALHGHSQKVAYSNYLSPVAPAAERAAAAVGEVIGGGTPNLQLV